jgi:Putative adhesin
MKRTMLVPILAVVAVSVFPLEGAFAQENTPPSDQECSARNLRVNDLATYAESRQERLSASSANRIDPGQNGSVRIHGWDQSDVLVRACILAAAPSESEARTLTSQIKIAHGPGEIEADGPSENDSQHWSVSYEIWMPNASNLDAHANNGSISIDGVHGQIRFDTTNGSVRLSKVGGDVDGSTTNGSLRIDLAGNRWEGRGLHAETTNGSVRVYLPENYSARVEASTVNGRVHVDFPITVSGEIGRNLSFELGSGGPTIEARTTNGGIYIGRS